jgi:large subunit ribosomal protein L4
VISIPIYDVINEGISEKNINENYVNKKSSDELITQIIVRTRNNSRQGTACAKTRGEINFSTRKPWKQKGTGRARAGMRNSPIWVRGGVTFPPRPRDFSVSTTEKSRKLAFKSVFYEKAQNGDICLIKNLVDETHKTKNILNIISKTIPDDKKGKKMLVVYNKTNGNLNLCINNIKNIFSVESQALCTFDLIKYNTIIITEEAMADIEKRI